MYILQYFTEHVSNFNSLTLQSTLYFDVHELVNVRTALVH